MLDANAEDPTIAPLTDEQLRSMIERSFVDLRRRERAAWREVMDATVRRFQDRLRHLGVLASVIEYWRHLGLASVRQRLKLRGAREHSFWVATSHDGGRVREPMRGELTLDWGLLERPDHHALARALYAFGRRTNSNCLLLESASLYRAESRVPPRTGLVDALIAAAETTDEPEDELRLSREAVSVARSLAPPVPGLLSDALARLGASLHLLGHHDEAALVVDEAITLSRGSDSPPARLGPLLVLRGQVLQARGHHEEALITAEEALEVLREVPPEQDRALRFDLWNLFDECYTELGLAERAREAAARSIDIRRAVHASTWPQELLSWADRLLTEGALDDALEAALEATQLCAKQNAKAPYGTYAQSLTELAKIRWALGHGEGAVAALREAVDVYRAVIQDGGPWWSSSELAQTLQTLAGYLEELDPQAVVATLLDAARVLEVPLEGNPGQYPADLAQVLRRLGDAAAARQTPELAVGAYARIVELAAPFPARESSFVREVERRLEELCDQSNISREAALSDFHGLFEGDLEFCNLPMP
ncbi:hypothetical protein [Enhygromyxa salina]|uniref:hypothetical protein n=1 Tax=Enhygromyxa salina TaxID=215803 RepID=UPI0015E5D57B|nr:hypothetical protein [Enhygromyxa salina]